MLFLDLETYSSVDLKKSNVYRYSEAADFQILLCAYVYDPMCPHGQDFDDIRLASIDGMPVQDIPGLWDDDVTICAHNAQFERVCLSRLAWDIGKLEPHVYLSPSRFIDTMAIAAESGYPRSLDECAKALGAADDTAQQKDRRGKALIKFFSVPDRKTGSQHLPEDDPEGWKVFGEYCRQDVRTHRDIYYRLLKYLVPSEQRMWEVDQIINDNGIHVDKDMVIAAVNDSMTNKDNSLTRMSELTGLDNPNSNVQLLSWFHEAGLKSMKDLRKETVQGRLDSKAVNSGSVKANRVKEVLELRQMTSLVASKKYQAALNTLSDDNRLRGQFMFFGAHTGRWSSRGVQLQNLARDQFKKEDPETGKMVHDEVAEMGAIVDLKLGLNVPESELKKLVRAMFVGPFIVYDFSAIEARTLAWLSGEQWALDAFASGRDIYVETANRMSSPGNKLTRQQGKRAVLGLGYNGGITSMRIMGSTEPDEVVQAQVYGWRDANQNIVKFWSQLEKSFIYGGPAGKFVRVECDGGDRIIRLPSGRGIVYHNVKSDETLVNKTTGEKYTAKAAFDDPTKAGHRVGTYGGRLTENVTQAVARDLLGEAMVRLTDAGYDVVGHIHDEALIDMSGIVPEHDEDTNGLVEPYMNDIKSLMCENPKWAPGLPLNAEGWYGPRYKKD